jgi:3D (Asp-Asp-Asp) domain-containing protein
MFRASMRHPGPDVEGGMNTRIGVLALGALALGCSSLPVREAAVPAPRDRVEPPGECAVPAPPATPEPPPPQRSEGLVVTATAYNSLRSQGVGKGQHGAWGDRLKPGVKSIAVSKDLLALGLTRGAIVRIEGLPGEYVVLDRLPTRWSRRIDIYMGRDVRAARAWGKREVRIFPSMEVADDAPAAPLD